MEHPAPQIVALLWKDIERLVVGRPLKGRCGEEGVEWPSTPNERKALPF